MFICSIILLFITILLLTGSRPLKAIVFVLIVEIFSPCLNVTVSNLCIEICSASSESATTTWSSARKSVLMFLFLGILTPFIAWSVHSVITWFIYTYVKQSRRKGQPCRTSLLIFIGCVNEESSFIFISLFSFTFVIAVSNG